MYSYIVFILPYPGAQDHGRRYFVPHFLCEKQKEGSAAINPKMTSGMLAPDTGLLFDLFLCKREKEPRVFSLQFIQYIDAMNWRFFHER
ncbi:hypothetical protein, partial [uncultured Dubosiella sp.]